MEAIQSNSSQLVPKFVNLNGSRFSLLENQEDQEETEAGMVNWDDGGPRGEEIGG